MQGRETTLSVIPIPVVVIALLAAAFFLVSMASFARAANISGKAATVKGQITAVSSYARTVTVKPITGLSQEKTADIYTFFVNRKTGITACAQNRTFYALGSNQKVNVSYHRLNGKLVADSIDIQGTDLASCYIY